MAGATIKLFLPTGEAQSLRVVEISNWSGLAVAAPRTELDSLLKRPELDKPGVYLLIGTDPKTDRPAAYVGEAEVVRDRLRQHGGKEFWVQAILFVSQGENLTKSHIRYLEGQIIEEATRIGRFLILNAQSSGARLPESDQGDMEVFLGRIRQLLPVLGCDILVPVVQTSKDKASQELVCTIKGLTARGQRSPQGFVVFKGSEASLNLRPSAQERAAWVIGLRDKLLQNKVLVVEDDRLRFAQDFEFSSPSAAAAIIHGGHANGLTAWKTADGKTLKELEVTV
jgi:hypothetical protein